MGNLCLEGSHSFYWSYRVSNLGVTIKTNYKAVWWRHPTPYGKGPRSKSQRNGYVRASVLWGFGRAAEKKIPLTYWIEQSTYMTIFSYLTFTVLRFWYVASYCGIGFISCSKDAIVIWITPSQAMIAHLFALSSASEILQLLLQISGHCSFVSTLSIDRLLIRTWKYMIRDHYAKHFYMLCHTHRYQAVL